MLVIYQSASKTDLQPLNKAYNNLCKFAQVSQSTALVKAEMQ